MSGGFVSEAVRKGFVKMVDAGCSTVSAKITEPGRLSEQEKQGVKGLLCESMTFAATLMTERNAGPVEVGVHLIVNGINMGKLTKRQQVYCAALKAQIAVNAAKLAGTAYATFLTSVAGAQGGILGGGLTGTVVAGPGGTVAGAAIGGVIGAGGPLILGSYEMFETIATVTDLAIDHHSQCGPLALDTVSQGRNPMPPPALH